jgi:hypothetical protein
MDYSFYLEFQNNPEGTLAAYELSPEQRAALTESGTRLLMLLGQSGSPLHTTNNFLPLESTEPDFNPDEMLKRAEVRETVAQVLGSSAGADRLTPILALMEEIGGAEHGRTHRRLA